MVKPRRGFRTPPEVTGYFDGKGDLPSFSYLDVFGEEHAYAWTAAKAVDVELRTVLRQSISTAIAEGRGLETWKKALQPELERLGWWGPRMVADPSGLEPDRLVDFSAPRRLETIFYSNMRSARAAGQWERAQRTKRALPYLLYVRTAAQEPRAEHLAWAGTILPVDHPWWRTHFPPNGWGCKCSVRQVTVKERDQLLAREEGETRYKAEPVDDGPPRQFRNRRTGEVTAVPVGIDPGWHTNPGLARAETLIENLANRLEAANPADATPALQQLWDDPFLRIAPQLPQKVWLPAGVSPRLAEELPAARSPLVSVDTAAIISRVEDHGMTMDNFALLPVILAKGLILPDPRGNPDVRGIVARFGKTWWRAFVRLSAGGYLRVTSLHQRDTQRLRAVDLQPAGRSLEDVPDFDER